MLFVEDSKEKGLHMLFTELLLQPLILLLLSLSPSYNAGGKLSDKMTSQPHCPYPGSHHRKGGSAFLSGTVGGAWRFEVLSH